jgi:hypothetical protein
MLVRQNAGIPAATPRFVLGVSQYASDSSSYFARNSDVLFGRENANAT